MVQSNGHFPRMIARQQRLPSRVCQLWRDSGNHIVRQADILTIKGSTGYRQLIVLYIYIYKDYNVYLF